MVRSRNQNADVGEAFGNVPLDGTANSFLSSFRMSSRHSRLSLLASARFDRVTATGYFEGDFLGSSTSANEVESNDSPLRVRQFWGDAELSNGISFLAGQTWTLLTTHQDGLRPLNEYLALALSAQHVVGFNWARQTGFRVTKDFGNGVRFAAALLPISGELDLLLEGLAGRGIGRYAAAVGPDLAIGPDGSVHRIRATQAITGIDWKATHALQLYNYVGLEFYGRTSFPGSTVGYGSPLLDLSPCVSQAGFPCPGGNRSIWQIMPGIWYSLARSEHGMVVLGISFLHTRRALWSGLGGMRPGGRENSFVSSIRYHLP